MANLRKLTLFDDKLLLNNYEDLKTVRRKNYIFLVQIHYALTL